MRRNGSRWTKADDDYLLAHANMSVNDLQHAMNRHTKTIRKHANMLGLDLPPANTGPKRMWTDAEDRMIVRLAEYGVEAIHSELPHRTIRAIDNRAQLIGVRIKRFVQPQIKSKPNRPPTKYTAYLVRTDIEAALRRGKSIEYAIARCADGYGRTVEQIKDYMENPKYDKQVAELRTMPIDEEKTNSAIKRLLKKGNII